MAHVDEIRAKAAKESAKVEAVRATKREFDATGVDFSGDRDAQGRYTAGVSWAQWAFVMSAYATAVAPRLAQLMKDAALCRNRGGESGDRRD